MGVLVSGKLFCIWTWNTVIAIMTLIPRDIFSPWSGGMKKTNPDVLVIICNQNDSLPKAMSGHWIKKVVGVLKSETHICVIILLASW